MITKRFQAWRISPNRANEFRRTHRSCARRTPMLMQRVLGFGDPGAMYIDMPCRKKRKLFKRTDLARCRPAARTSPSLGPFQSGPLHCVRVADFREFFSNARPYPRGRVPCSVATHRLLAMGYMEWPF